MRSAVVPWHELCGLLAANAFQARFDVLQVRMHEASGPPIKGDPAELQDIC